MGLHYATLETLIADHSGWQLLRHDEVALAASVLDRAFVAANMRALAEEDLLEALDDVLYELREEYGRDKFPRPALDYVEAWSAPARAWLRKFYPPGSDEAHYELTPEALQAIAWLGTLTDRGFVGTEAKVALLIDLAGEMCEGAEPEPQRRLESLRERRDAIDAEISRIEAGDGPMLDATAMRDRLQQYARLSDELLADFRAAERDLHRLDRSVRECVASSDAVLQASPEQSLPQLSALIDSDTGRSLQAAWDRLVARFPHEALVARLAKVLALPAVAEPTGEERVRRSPYDWLEAGDHARRTLAELTTQLGRFSNARTWLEKRRIAEIVGDIEAKAAGLRDHPPAVEVSGIAAAITALERGAQRSWVLAPSERDYDSVDARDIDEAGSAASDDTELAHYIGQALATRGQVSLRELVEARPLTRGLAELLGYVQLAQERFTANVEDGAEVIAWDVAAADGRPVRRQAEIPRIVFVR